MESFFLVACIVARRSVILGVAPLAMSLSLKNVDVGLHLELWNASRQPQMMINLFVTAPVGVRRIVEGIDAVNVAALFQVPITPFLEGGTHISVRWHAERS